MALHFGQRLHSFTHRLFRSRDQTETARLHQSVVRLFQRAGMQNDADRQRIITAIAAGIAVALEIEPESAAAGQIKAFTLQLFDYEQIWWLAEIDWSKKRETSAWWELREELNRQRSYLIDFDQTVALVVEALVPMLSPFAQNPPESVKSSNHDLTVKIPLFYRVSGLPDALQEALEIINAPELVEANLFTRLRGQFDRNLIVASGGNPADARGYSKAPVLPTRSALKDPAQLTEAYVGATPLVDYLKQPTELVIPTETRFEHLHMVAGSGHGKSQSLQYLIAQDLPAVAAGERSVVVIDSQGDLINTISRLKEFAPGGALHERLVLIDPTDIEYPVSLNLFDVGKDRLAGYEALERERLTNSILELYDFVLGSLLDAGMTQKQSVIFRYVTRLMLHIEGATIQTLRELMEEGSEHAFAADIAKLTGTARKFFETEFGDREFKATRKQVLRRLWGILENQTFERMFSHPKSKLDLFSEMNAGKIILINTAKDLLKEQGTQIFGRFFIAMIAQAAQERATLPKDQRLPTFVYIDEAADYFDRNIGIILSTARKYNTGMVLAHQFLGQLDAKLQEAFAANTSIKLVGGVSAKDARSLAPMLYCQSDVIERQGKGSFASYVRGVTSTALPISFPFGYVEAREQMSVEERKLVRQRMREQYAVHVSELSMESVSAEVRESGPGDAPRAKSKPIESRPKSTGSSGVDIEPGDEW